MGQKLRPYQIDADAGVRKAFKDGSKSVLLVLPTGAGKTTTFAHWIIGAINKGSYVIFLAHRRELIKQASERLTEHDVKHGVIQAGSYTDFNKQVQVASIQSLLPRIYPADEETAPTPPRATILVFDEAHRATSASYKKIIAKYPDALVCGLTATPARTDGRGLGDVFDALVEVIDVADLIEQGYLCDYVMYEGEYDAPDADLKIIGDDFDDGEAEKRLDTDKLVGDVYKNWCARAKGKRTIVFAQTRKHGKHIDSVFVVGGERCKYLDGNTPAKDRDKIIADFSAGHIDVIVNVNILVEGFDVPGIECVVLAFMTASIIKYRQAIGRDLRPLYALGLPLDTAEQRLRAIALSSKPHAIILDHGGNARHRFGGPDAPHEWSLDGRKKREAPVQPSLTTCPTCRAIVTSRTRICPDCGYEFSAAPIKSALPTTTDGMLVEANYKIRGSEREERRLAKIAAMTEKERKAAEREQARAAKVAAEAAKLARLEEEREFFRKAVAAQRAKGYNWRYPLMKFKERFVSEKRPKGYFPGEKHGVKIEYRPTGLMNPVTGRPGFEMISFEFEGVVYGA